MRKKRTDRDKETEERDQRHRKTETEIQGEIYREITTGIKRDKDIERRDRGISTDRERRRQRERREKQTDRD